MYLLKLSFIWALVIRYFNSILSIYVELQQIKMLLVGQPHAAKVCFLNLTVASQAGCWACSRALHYYMATLKGTLWSF